MGKTTTASWLALAVCALGLSGCVMVVGPRRAPPPPVYMAAPPPCPAGFGWTPGVGCTPLPVVVPPPPAPVLTRVAASYLNLRACPSTQCQASAVLRMGDIVRVLGCENGWARVWAPGLQTEGWVSSRYLSD